MTQPFLCPHCGTLVPASAAACPECGSDAQTGWSAPASDLLGDDTLDLPTPALAQRRSPFIAGVAIVLIVSLLAPLVGLWGSLVLLVLGIVGVGIRSWQQTARIPDH